MAAQVMPAERLEDVVSKESRVSVAAIQDEGFIRDAVHGADANALRLALCQSTSDKTLEAMEVQKVDFLGGAVMDFVLSKEDQDKVRTKAIEYLLNQPAETPSLPSEEESTRLMDIFSGNTTATEDQKTIFDYSEGYEELAFDKFPRDVRWTNAQPPAETLEKWKVIIIGAGLSGIAAAIPFKQLGIPFEIIDRQSGIGGTWLQNNYPNVRVDSPAYLFQYRFSKNYKWKEHFPSGSKIRQYLEEVASEYSLSDHMRFNREVITAVWDKESSKWNLTLRLPDGSEEHTSCNAVISCGGLFNKPSLPNIKGIETFKGPLFHTSRWDHNIDYQGKRVALIGTGSTGTQLAPALARTAGHLSVFQRTANWIVPFDLFSMPVSDGMHWICENMPFYWNWYCFGNFLKSLNFGSLQSFDEEWRTNGGYVSERNDNVRKSLLEFIQYSLADRPDLIAKMTPTHAPMVRRMVVDNGFYKTVKLPNVDLLTEGIECITETGIRTKDGTEREFDMIVLGAGFQVSRYLWPTNYVGIDGMTLDKAWAKDGARAYLGMTMPHFPNLFMAYGPNHQPRGGSIHSFAEKWARYSASAIVGMIERDIASMEVKKEVFDAYNDKLDQAIKKLIWEFDGSGYFVNEHGRQGVNMPWSNAEYHPMVAAINFEDFHMGG